MWPSSARQINYGGGGLPPEMSMFVLAHHDQSSIVSDIHAINASNAATALGVGVGVIPLLSATPCLPQQTHHIDNNNNTAVLHSSRGVGRGGGMNLWQDQPPSQHQQTWRSNLATTTTGSGGGGGSASSSTTTCQDCGNQAKKDCTHRRCRTCCKSRGFDCSTHVKSTWVPAARRRERQLMAVTTTPTAGSSGSTSGSKKPRLVTSQNTATSHTSASNTPPRSFDTSSSHHHYQDASFKETLPGQVRAPAVFKCVRVTAMDDGDDQFAYQAMVKIGGHVFKGFLYDQGVEGRDGFPNISELHLGGGGDGGRNGASSSAPIIDPSDVYGASGGGFLGGPSYVQGDYSVRYLSTRPIPN